MDESDVMARDEFAELLREGCPGWKIEEGEKALTQWSGIPSAPCVYAWPDGVYLITVFWDIDQVIITHGFQREVWRTFGFTAGAEKIVESVQECARAMPH